MNRELETRYNQMKQTWKNLVNANVELVDENKYLKEEIERLNNIINDFEEDTGLEHNTFIDIRNTLKTVLRRLQELKGSDKE